MKKRIQLQPRRLRALAIPAASRDERVLMFLHLLAAMMLPLLMMLLLGCDPKYKGEKIDYGSEAQAADVNKAILDPLATINLGSVKLGEFVHFSLSQSLNGDPNARILTDTSRTITNLCNRAKTIDLEIVQSEVTYNQDGTSQEVGRSFPISLSKEASSSAAVMSLPALDAGVSSQRPQLLSCADPLATLKSAVPARIAMLKGQSTTGLHTMAESRKTFHRLKTYIEEVAPPPAVQQAPNCGGVPNCRLRVHRVTFDVVDWSTEAGERTTVEIAVAPDLPVLASPFFDLFYRDCATRTVSVGESGSRVLVKQCTSVENFKFGTDAESCATPTPTPTPTP